MASPELETRRDQLQEAANIELGMGVKAWYDAPPATSPDAAAMAVPGERFSVIATLWTGQSSERTNPENARLQFGTARRDGGGSARRGRPKKDYKFQMTPCAQGRLHTAVLASTRSGARRAEYDRRATVSNAPLPATATSRAHGISISRPCWGHRSSRYGAVQTA